MEIKNHDWTKFTRRIAVHGSPQNIYYLISTQDGLECWFLRLAEFTKPDQSIRSSNSEIQKGDTYRWMWHGYSDEVVEKGRIINANSKDTIRFTFAGECLVTITAQSYRELTIVEITQENIPTDEVSKVNYYVGCSEGWVFYLANLKSIVEGGIDLRNRDETIQGVLNS
jgi:hypothetical protein